MKNRIMLCIINALLVVAMLSVSVSATETTSPETASTESSLSAETAAVTEEVTEAAAVDEPKEKEGGADIASITLVMSSITAIAAIVAPVLNSLISSKNQLRMKDLEIRLPAAYEKLDALILAYGKLERYGEDYRNFPEDNRGKQLRFRDFTVAFYQVLPLIPDIDIHKRSRALISEMASDLGGSDEKTDAVFYDIIADIALHISGAKPELLHKRQAKVEDQNGAAE